MTEGDSKPKGGKPKCEEPVGGGLYIDQRGKRKSYVWRGRVNGKPVRKVLCRPETGMTATIQNTTLTEARRFAKQYASDAVSGGIEHFAHIEAKPKPGDFNVTQAWADYMKHEGSKLRARTTENKASHFRRFIEPRWGAKPVRAITTKDCKALLNEVRREFEAKRLVGAQVNVLHSNLSKFFRFCAKRDEYRVEFNPMLPLDERPINESLTRAPARDLTEVELRWFFQAAEQVAVTRRRGVEATEFLLRACLRRNEAFLAKWSWLLPDGLLVPAELAKNSYAILVPLTPTMLDLIGPRPANAKDEDRIFDWSLSWLIQTIRQIRPIMKRISGVSGDFDVKGDPRYFSLHNFRDTAFTLMGEPLDRYEQPIFSKDTRNGLLNHRPADVGSKRYDGKIQEARWLYGARKAAGAYWDDWLSRLKTEALEQSLPA